MEDHDWLAEDESRLQWQDDACYSEDSEYDLGARGSLDEMEASVRSTASDCPIYEPIMMILLSFSKSFCSAQNVSSVCIMFVQILRHHS